MINVPTPARPLPSRPGPAPSPRHQVDVLAAVIMTPRQRIDSQLAEEFACSHPDIQVVKVTSVNGAKQYCRHCPRCGHSTDWIARVRLRQKEWIEAPERDPGVAQRWLQARIDRNNELWAEGRPDRQAEYQEYLKGPVWRRKKYLVMERANRMCEGCGEEPATDVHHTIYEHRGDEFLWELRAVCRGCHKKLHGMEVEPASTQQI